MTGASRGIGEQIAYRFAEQGASVVVTARTEDRLKKVSPLCPHCYHAYTVVPVMNGHPRDQAKVSVHCRWPLIRGMDGHVEMSRDISKIENVAVHSRWPLTTGVAQGRYYCIIK